MDFDWIIDLIFIGVVGESIFKNGDGGCNGVAYKTIFWYGNDVRYFMC